MKVWILLYVWYLIKNLGTSLFYILDYFATVIQSIFATRIGNKFIEIIRVIILKLIIKELETSFDQIFIAMQYYCSVSYRKI